MGLFGCEEGHLAKYLVQDPKIYNNAIAFFDGLKDREVFDSRLERSLQDDLNFLERANTLARNSDYYVFEVEDTWGIEKGGGGFGDPTFDVYQMVDGGLVRVLDVMEYFPRGEIVEKFLHDKKVKKVFTACVPLEGYYGVKDSFDEGDEHEIIYSEASSQNLHLKDIEIIFLNS